jgi:hypothetical protein
MITTTSTIYGEGQRFTSSNYQGSTYMGVSYTLPLKFDGSLSITTETKEAIEMPTVSNYTNTATPFFMGSFDGFWIHKLYREGNLVYTVQGVDQDMFLPIAHDYVESVAMITAGNESIPCPDCPVRPPVPAPSVSVMLGVAALFAISRKRKI